MDSFVPGCQICRRQTGTLLPFYCPTCARNVVYEPRLLNTRAILTRERAGSEIEKALKQEDDGSKQPQINELGKDERAAHYSAAFRHAQTQIESSKARFKDIRDASRDIAEEIESIRTEIGLKKEAVARRKSDLAKAKQGLSRQEGFASKPLEKSYRSTEESWKITQDRSARGGLYLVSMISTLGGLTHRRRRKGHPGRDQYLLGSVPIVDLRDLNNSHPAHITHSANQVAQFIHLAAHYLSLRLPAEIFLTSRGVTHASILSPASSYRDPYLPSGLKNAPSSSQPLSANANRRRPLFINQPLGMLASEDPVAYSLFIEAIGFLAWDVAWLAQTQGLDVSLNGWEEICAIGKTLYSVFGVASPFSTSQSSQRPPVNRTSTSDTARGPSFRRQKAIEESPILHPTPGSVSHGSARSYLPASGEIGGAAESMRAWPFANPIRLIERVKSALASERMGAEWEVLQKDEWEGEGEEAARKTPADSVLSKEQVEALAVKHHPLRTTQLLGDDAGIIEGHEASEESGEQKGRRGWTRLRSQAGQQT